LWRIPSRPVTSGVTDLLSIARDVPLSAQLAGLVCLLAFIVLGLRKRTARPDIVFDLDWSDKPSIWLTGALLASLFAFACLSIIPHLLWGLVVSTIGAAVVIYYLSRGPRSSHPSSPDTAAGPPTQDTASHVHAIRLDKFGAFSDGGDTVRVVLGRLFDGSIDSVVVSHGDL
jgi:hypothetical protein